MTVMLNEEGNFGDARLCYGFARYAQIAIPIFVLNSLLMSFISYGKIRPRINTFIWHFLVTYKNTQLLSSRTSLSEWNGYYVVR